MILSEHLLDHGLLLGYIEHFDTCLHYTTAVLVGRVLEHLALDVAKDNVEVLFADAVHQLNLLDHVVAKTVQD
jgi:hypothetical protein